MSKTIYKPKLSLVETHPEIATQWNKNKNGNLKPNEVTFGFHKKVWWKCPIAEDHIWLASINSRTNKKTGCPCCNGNKVATSNCLATLFPNIAKEWHKRKNGTITPFDITSGSGKKVWWQCSIINDHEYQTSIHSRTSMKSGCPYCRGLKTITSNCLATLFPDIAKQWHPTMNDNLTPHDVTPGSNKIVWWKCPIVEDHKWKASICDRTHRSRGCSCCSGKTVVMSNCLATIYPNITAEWHPTKNIKLTAHNVSPHSGHKVWWQCSSGHEWKSAISNRTNGSTNCPYCKWSMSQDTPRIFYFVLVSDQKFHEQFLNIGITVKSLKIRYGRQEYKALQMQPIFTIKMPNELVIRLEQEIKNNLSKFRFIPQTKAAGMITESFQLEAKDTIQKYCLDFCEKHNISPGLK
jgi:hypothetical protein